MLVRVYTSENVKLLEITFHGSNLIRNTPIPRNIASYRPMLLFDSLPIHISQGEEVVSG